MSSDFPQRDADGRAIITGPLYHYTSVEALKGIVDDGVLHATHAFYMSDASEIRYGVGRIQERCAHRAPTDELPRELLEATDKWLRELLFLPQPICTACFSQKADDLNQWRSYTPRSGGMCLAFDAPQLFARARDQGWEWSNCKYEQLDQAKWADEALDALARGKIGRSDKGRPFIADTLEGITNVLQIACRLKDPAFREEQEWRLISPLVSAEEIHYRVQGPMLIPFARFDLGDIHKNGVIREIIVGPTAHRELSFNSVMGYVMSNLKSNVKVWTSHVPYRVL
jgi:hypothetical protein